MDIEDHFSFLFQWQRRKDLTGALLQSGEKGMMSSVYPGYPANNPGMIMAWGVPGQEA